MDNSLSTYKQKIEDMINELERFADMLNYHVIIEPRETIEDAVRYGFPEDIASNYLQNYYAHNEADAQSIIRYIKNESIPYLRNVAYYIECAMNIGSPIGRDQSINHLTIGSKPGIIDSGNVGSYQGRIPPPIIKSPSELAYRTYQLIKRDEDYRKYILDLEKALGIKQGHPMSIEEADKQNANPNLVDEYLEDTQGDFIDPITRVRYRKNPAYDVKEESKYEPYNINCATCVIAFALRSIGFDVRAKGNVLGSGSLNEQISKNVDTFLDVWKNQDGSEVELSHTDDWMKKNKIRKMSTEDYRTYFEEECKEKGMYVALVRYKGRSSGHAAILYRDTDGVLYYIEPQRYERSKGENGMRSLDDLLMNSLGKQKLSVNPSHGYGVLRLDGKRFNTEYANLLETNKYE